jgi:hypothetical protein
MIFQSCNKTDDCTRIGRIGGVLLPERYIEVPYNLTEPLPKGGIEHHQYFKKI